MIRLRTRAATLVARRGDRTIAATPLRRFPSRSLFPRLFDLPGSLTGSEAALDRVLAIDPTCPAGSIAGAAPDERGDVIEVPAEMFERIHAAGMTITEIALLRARLLRRRGDRRVALRVAGAAPDATDDAF